MTGRCGTNRDLVIAAPQAIWHQRRRLRRLGAHDRPPRFCPTCQRRNEGVLGFNGRETSELIAEVPGVNVEFEPSFTVGVGN